MFSLRPVLIALRCRSSRSLWIRFMIPSVTHKAPTGVLHDQSFCSLVYQLSPTKSQPLSRFFLYGAWAAWSQFVVVFVVVVVLIFFFQFYYYSFICQPLLRFELRTEAVSFSCWLHNFQYSHPYRSNDRLSPPPSPPHPEQRTNQHHVVTAPRRSSAKFGEAKLFFLCISIDRTTTWSLQMEIIVLFSCLLSGLHLFCGSPLTIVGQWKSQSS